MRADARKRVIALIGCGHMGRALLNGWRAAGLEADYLIVDPAARLKAPRVRCFKKPGEFLLKADIVVLAVKPQVMESACAALRPFVNGRALIVSIAAGRTLKSLERAFARGQPVVRTMPNLPAAVGKGMAVAIANKNASAARRRDAERLMLCVGKVAWIKNEKLMDVATALSGSGPAYVFFLMEALAKAGKKLGLGAEAAETLARQTVIGAAALAEAEPDIAAAILRANVTSPGGTTEAALKVMMDGRMEKIFQSALAKAAKRSQDLSA